MELATALVDDLVRRALGEDLGDTGDLTTRLCVTDRRRGTARVVAKAAGVVAGQVFARRAFLACDPEAAVAITCADGERVEPGAALLRIEADGAAILAAERTALNFLQRLSGIATATRRFVDAVAGTGAVVLETRKTTPTLRAIEKYAVRVGGGTNHRAGLFDQVLIKENHFELARPAGYEEVVRRAAERAERPVIAEARDLGEAVAAVRGGAAVVLLDNFGAGAALREAVRAVRDEARALGRAVAIEASGGITLDTARAVAECGVDRLSVGALTHSAPALDLSLLVEGFA